MNLAKILKIATIVMIAITVIVLSLFIWGGDLPNELYKTPLYTDALLGWAYILFFVSVVGALIFPIVTILTNPKAAMKGIVGVASLLLIIGVSYALADGTVMNIPGYSGDDNVPSTLIFSDVVLYTMYILGISSILAIIATEIYRKVK